MLGSEKIQIIIKKRRGKGMNSIYRDIFRAIHEGKWISIEYKNKEEKVT